MTKDWEHWEDEIKRLYATKTLHEVREILKIQGFEASIRAYRMKLDGWGIQKNASASTRKRRRIETSQSHNCNSEAHHFEESKPSQDIPQSSVEYSTPLRGCNDSNAILDADTHLKASLLEYPFTLPNGRLEADELMKCLPWHLRERRLLIVLLINWEADGTYLKAALRNMDKTDLNWLWSKSLFEGNIFKIIDEKLDPHEKACLTKSFLSHMFVKLSTSRRIMWKWWEWAVLLVDIAETPSWAERKSLLKHASFNREVMGQSFVDCAPIVAAESLLSSLKSNLREKIKDGETTLNVSDILNVRDKYMGILNDFADAKSSLDLDPIYYKFALYIDRWYEQRQATKLQTISNNFKVVQHDLTLLKEEHSTLQQQLSDNRGLIASSSVESEAVSYGMHPESACACISSGASATIPVTYGDSFPLIFTQSLDNSDAVLVFLDLLQTWQEKKNLVSKIVEYNLATLTLDKRDTPVDLCLGPNRLFDLISTRVDRSNRMPFKKALMEAFGERCRYMSVRNTNGDSSLQSRWLELYRAPYWKRFQAFREAFELSSKLYTSEMSVNTLRSVSECTAALVGMRLLEIFVCKLESRTINTNSAVYETLRDESLDIAINLGTRPHLLEPSDDPWRLLSNRLRFVISTEGLYANTNLHWKDEKLASLLT